MSSSRVLLNADEDHSEGMDEVRGLIEAQPDHEVADRKATVSIWSKFHFSSVSIPTLVANLLLGQELPVGLGQLRVELGDKGQTARIWLPHGGGPLTSRAPHARFSTLFDEHCAPLIETLASLSGLSPKVFWSNLGHYVEYAGRTCSQHPVFKGAGEPLLHLLEARTLPAGRRNPLYQSRPGWRYAGSGPPPVLCEVSSARRAAVWWLPVEARESPSQAALSVWIVARPD